jgi:radical SAM superfamily enzyme YgiQ (UPF0313 family)
MQATIVIPYPGTPLYKECIEKEWLIVDSDEYEAFDMRGPVMKVPFSKEKLLELTQELYSSFFSVSYIFRKILSIRSKDDIKFFVFSAWKLLGHLLDFDKEQTKVSFWSPKFIIKSIKKLINNQKFSFSSNINTDKV